MWGISLYFLRLIAHGGVGILYWARKIVFGILYRALGVLCDLCHQIPF